MTHFHRYLTFFLMAVGAVMAAHSYGNVISTANLPEIDNEKIAQRYFDSLKKEDGAFDMEGLDELEKFFSPLIGSHIICVLYADSIFSSPTAYDRLIVATDICEKMMENIEYLNHPAFRYLRLKTLGLRPAHLYLAEAYGVTAQFQKADSVYMLIEKNMREDFGTESEEYVEWSLRVSNELCSRGSNYTKALKVMEPGINAALAHPAIPPDLSFNFLFSFAEKSDRAGLHNQAMKYGKEALDRAMDPEQIYDANLLYGRLLGAEGRFEEAEKCFSVAAKNCYDLYQFLNNSYSFAYLLIESGDAEAAVRLLKELGERYMKDPSLKPIDYFLYYETLGVAATYTDMDLSKEAFKKAEEFINVVPKDILLRHILNSQIYPYTDNSFKVISALDRAMFVYSAFIEDDPRMLTELLYLKGYYYNSINDDEMALRYLGEAFQRARNLGDSDPLLARTSREIVEWSKKNSNIWLRKDGVDALLRLSSNLPGDSRQRLDALEEAIDFYLDTHDVPNSRKYLGEYFQARPNSMETFHFTIRLGLLMRDYDNVRALLESLEKQGDSERMQLDKLWEEFYANWLLPETAIYARRNLENYRKELASRLLFMNSKERRNLSGELEKRRDKAISMIDNIPGMEEVALDYSLMIKGLLYATEKKVRANLNDIPNAKVDLDTLQSLRNQLNVAEAQGKADICSYLRERIASRERYIINDFVDFKEFEEEIKKQSLNSVREKIPEDVALVDFVGLRKGKWFGAFVIDGKTKKVHFVKIASRYKLNKMPYGAWLLLDSLLQDKKDVYFSTDGVLSSKPMEYLVDENGRPYSNRYRLHRVFHLADINRNLKPGRELVAIGVSDHNSPIGKGETIDRGSWTDLTKVKDELEIIRNRMGCEHLRVLFNDEARESAVKSLDGDSVNLLHISTHGFYRDRDALAKAVDSIAHPDHQVALRAVAVGKTDLSGLVLRKGNLSWKSAEILDEEDDLLTAEEIELMSFPNLELTVLSACDTGLGETDSEGVWGLQRAFRIAGTKNLVCTLSKVDDYWTAQFMDVFYEHLAKGEAIFDAFHEAQGWLRREVPDNPEIWSAFILIE